MKISCEGASLLVVARRGACKHLPVSMVLCRIFHGAAASGTRVGCWRFWLYSRHHYFGFAVGAFAHNLFMCETCFMYDMHSSVGIGTASIWFRRTVIHIRSGWPRRRDGTQRVITTLHIDGVVENLCLQQTEKILLCVENEKIRFD